MLWIGGFQKQQVFKGVSVETVKTPSGFVAASCPVCVLPRQEAYVCEHSLDGRDHSFHTCMGTLPQKDDDRPLKMYTAVSLSQCLATLDKNWLD